jgi:hypothetical protein
MGITIDGNKVIYNVSDGLINYSQRNNKYVLKRKNSIINYTNVCNVESICMGSSYAGWIFPDEPYSQYEQEGDRLTAFCLEDKRVLDFYKEKMPVLWKEWNEDKPGALPPNQVHRVLEFATNTWFGARVVTFSESFSILYMLSQLIEENLPVVVSGNFPKSSGSKEKIGHIVVLVGAVYDKENITYESAKPTHLIFDDPWGNFMEGYEKKLPGNDIVCPFDEAIGYLKPLNISDKKWGYTFNRGAAIV